jgi:hypothetical protein
MYVITHFSFTATKYVKVLSRILTLKLSYRENIEQVVWSAV